MGLNRYRNKPCQCGKTEEKIVWESDVAGGAAKQVKKQIPVKFKYCCLQDHYKQQAGLVTRLAKKVQEKTAKYFQKRYEKITNDQ